MHVYRVKRGVNNTLRRQNVNAFGYRTVSLTLVFPLFAQSNQSYLRNCATARSCYTSLVASQSQIAQSQFAIFTFCAFRHFLPAANFIIGIAQKQTKRAFAYVKALKRNLSNCANSFLTVRFPPKQLLVYNIHPLEEIRSAISHQLHYCENRKGIN